MQKTLPVVSLLMEAAINSWRKNGHRKNLFLLNYFAGNGLWAFVRGSMKKMPRKSATQRCLIRDIKPGSKKINALFFPVLIATTLLYANYLPAQNTSQIPELKKDLVNARSDSDRVDALAMLCFNYSNVNSDTALLFGGQAMVLSRKINYAKGIAECYNNLGWVYYCRSDLGKAEEYLKTSMELFKKTGGKDHVKIPLANLGTLYMDMTEYAKSMDCFMQVLKYEEEADYEKDSNNEENKISTLHEIGRLYNLLKKPEEARKYFQAALENSRKMNSDNFIGQQLISIGNTYQMQGKQQNALQYYDECMQHLSKTDDHVLLGLLYENIAQSYYFLKKYNPAVKNYKAAIELYTINKNREDIFAALIGLSEVYSAVKDSVNGMRVLNEASKYSVELNNKTDQQLVLMGLSDFYEQYGDYKKAYEYLDSSYKVKDSLFTLEKQDQLVKLQTQFETERKEKEIALLKKDRQLNLASLQKHVAYQYAAYIILFLLALIGFLVINRYRTVQRAKRLIEIEQVRNNIARNLHDDIGSTLTSINILSKVALQQTTAGNQASANMQKIKDRSSAIMESMNDIVWSINPANDALDKIILRMKEFGTETLEQAGIQAAFAEDGNLNSIKLSLEQRNDLYLIFKEAVNNAVKYSAASLVMTTLKKEKDELIMQVKDNGKGFYADQPFSGNGLKNMQSRAKNMRALLQIKSSPGQGTAVLLSVPIV